MWLLKETGKNEGLKNDNFCSEVESRGIVMSLAQSEPSKVLHCNKSSVSSKLKKRKNKLKRERDYSEKESKLNWKHLYNRSEKINVYENKRERKTSVEKRLKFETEKDLKTPNDNRLFEENRLTPFSSDSYQTPIYKQDPPFDPNSTFLPNSRFPYAPETAGYPESYLPSYHVLYHYHHHHHHHGQDKRPDFPSPFYCDQSQGRRF